MLTEERSLVLELSLQLLSGALLPPGNDEFSSEWARAGIPRGMGNRAGKPRVAGPQPAEVPPSDEELMARMQAKDRKGSRPLYSALARLVFGIAFRTLNDKSEAEEVVQEVFFTLYQKALLFDPL